MESLLIARYKPILNKADSSLPLELFWYNTSGYHLIFYHIIWCPSIPLCVYNCRLFSFHYYVTSFVFYQKQNVRAFIITLGVTRKALAFESWPEINGFAEILVIFFSWLKPFHSDKLLTLLYPRNKYSINHKNRQIVLPSVRFLLPGASSNM